MTDKPWLKFYDKGVPESLKPYPEKPLQQFLEESAAKYPDHVAIQFKPSHQGFAKSQLTYRELNDLSDRMAAALADAGREERRSGGDLHAQHPAVHHHVLRHPEGRRGGRRQQSHLHRAGTGASADGQRRGGASCA